MELDNESSNFHFFLIESGGWLVEKKKKNGGERKNWNPDVQHPVSLLEKIIFKKQEFIFEFFISIISLLQP